MNLLNLTLHTFPKLQQDIELILTKWRCFKVVFTCDIIKMFRQILLDPCDCDWLRLVYDFGEGLKHYHLCTVTQGTVPAPFQSLRVLRKIAEGVRKLYTRLLKVFKKSSYVDDFFVEADMIKKLLSLRDKLITALKSAKIELSKWSSNDHQVLLNLLDIERNDKAVNIIDVTSTLGLKCN